MLSAIISNVVSTDPDNTLNLALDMLRTANIYQRRAIGKGLGWAAQLCQHNGQSDISRRMAEALRRRVDRDATTAFTAVSTQSGPSPLPARTQDTTPSRLIGSSRAPETSVFEIQKLSDPLRPMSPIR